MNKEPIYTVETDYEEIALCQYPVPSSIGPEYESDCGKLALYRFWWTTFEDSEQCAEEEMNLCQEHFDLVQTQEKEE